jgi:hypothetical protein
LRFAKYTHDADISSAIALSVRIVLEQMTIADLAAAFRGIPRDAVVM